jgi:hypothetical protein
MVWKAGLIPVVAAPTTDSLLLQMMVISLRPLQSSTTREPFVVPRLSISLPRPAMVNRTRLRASRQSTPFAS